MAWQFVRRVFKFMIGRLMSKLAPRLIFFQYTDLVNDQLDSKRRHYRVYQMRSHSELIIHQLQNKKKGGLLGLNQVRQNMNLTEDEAHILHIYCQNHPIQTTTVFTQFQESQRTGFQLIHVQILSYQVKPVSFGTFDKHNIYFSSHPFSRNKKLLKYKQKQGFKLKNLKILPYPIEITNNLFFSF